MPTEVADDAILGASLEALEMVVRMRRLMQADLDEYDMADRAREMNDEMNVEQETLEEAWRVMGSRYRSAWKRLLVHRRP